MGLMGFSFRNLGTFLKHDLCNAMVYFLEGGVMPKSVNSTILALIPKCDNPETFADFRPISLCNFLYKIFSKLLARRLGAILPNLISEQQHGFVRGRQIGDCISISQEMVDDLDRVVRGKNMVMKLDMMKAYDRLEWDFLFKVLDCFDFSQKFISLITSCLSNQFFSVKLHGELFGFFQNSRGLRQGDPLSSSLFISVEEVLSRGLSRIFYQGLVKHYHLGRGVMSVSHLLFADDMVIFLNASKQFVDNLMKFLQSYESSSGQKISAQKSSLYVPKKMKATRRSLIMNATGMPIKDCPFIYLGCVISKGRVRRIYYEDLLNNMRRKLQGLYGKMLSHAGRVLLAKHVLNSMLSHCIAASILPVGVMKAMDSMVANFIWGSMPENKRRHWVSFHKLSRPLWECGLGIRSFVQLSDAYRLRQCWSLVENKFLWVTFMRSKYYLDDNISSFVLPAGASRVGKAVAPWIPFVVANSKFLIGSGEEVDFWHDNWLDDGGSDSPIKV